MRAITLLQCATRQALMKGLQLKTFLLGICDMGDISPTAKALYVSRAATKLVKTLSGLALVAWKQHQPARKTLALTNETKEAT